MSSLPLDPVWVPFAATKVAEEFLYFTLKLMTGKQNNDYCFVKAVSNCLFSLNYDKQHL